MKQTVRAIGCLLAALCLLTGCGAADAYPEGNTIACKDLLFTVPGDFIDLSAEGIDADADFLFGRDTLVFKGMAEYKQDLSPMTLEEYTARVISGNQLSCTPQSSGSGYIFSYEAPVADTVYTYTTATFEGASCFWILQFYCPSKNLTENQPEIDIILEGIQPAA